MSSGDLPRPPPCYDSPAAAGTSTEPLLGEDRARHSEDDIPDDFKYFPPSPPFPLAFINTPLTGYRYGVSVSQSDISIRMGFIRKIYGYCAIVYIA